MLKKHVDFQRANELVREPSPMLPIGAANVLSGEFEAFSGRMDRINANTILASAAYWDGLFSQNRPYASSPL